VLPVVHRVLHGLSLVSHHGTHCDHTRTGWHPDYEFLDGDCVLCQHNLNASGDAEHAVVPQSIPPSVVATDTSVSISTPNGQRSIRAPPADICSHTKQQPIIS